MRTFAPLVLVVAGGVYTACSDSETARRNRPAGAGGAADGGLPDGGATPDGSILPDLGVPSCMTGDPCGDGGVCTGDDCCVRAQACGDTCCAVGDVCSFLSCVTPGDECADPSDCAPGEYCEHALGAATDAGSPPPDSGACVGGVPAPHGRCLPKPPVCAPDAGVPDGGAIDCLAACEWRPPTTDFTPVEKYAWGGMTAAPYATDVMMTPVVVQLDDDDCDGTIGANDIPDIAFATFASGMWQGPGTLHVVSVEGGQLVEKWNAPGVTYAGAGMAGGNIDGNPGSEIVTCGATATSVRAFKGDGTPLWETPMPRCFLPAIADLDADGRPEVVVESGIVDGVTGQLEVTFSPPPSGHHTIGNLDGTGAPEIVFPNRAYAANGSVVMDPGGALPEWSWALPALVDFDHDGKPEVAVTVGNDNAFLLWHHDATAASKAVLLRAPFDAHVDPGGPWAWSFGMGPITAGDFDGDGTPDVGFVGFRGYVVLDGEKLMDTSLPNTLAALALWTKTTDEDNGSTGSAVFDFNGDGVVEVLYNDTQRVHIYDGKTGADLITPLCNTTGSLYEYPVVADVDNDGHADVILVANSFSNRPGQDPSYICDGTTQSGIRVLGSANQAWVRTRRTWNQHTYHVTNVGEDGTIPTVESDNWSVAGLNNFRQNKQPGNEFGAPDAVVSIAPRCTGEYGVVATVRNLGEAALPAGAGVGFYEGAPASGTKLGEAATTRILYPADAENLFLPLPSASPGVKNGTTPVSAYVLDPSLTIVQPVVHECRTDNNTATASAACRGPT